ncbi:response regulator transcription factor [Robinsoniella peoriensis]|uniref:response regulator transcription factor n=1 Tax=Robinsoniella peoriensis TaxID=180332 RepID=UPI00085BC0A1|nr:response regulator [Robinsoniella peoriensis]
MIKVLIAEDEIPLLRGIKNMIEKLNPEFSVVMCARNGKEAIEYLNSNQVDVIFTDINMPLADGIEVMEFANQKYPEAAKVVISGYSDFSYAQQAIRCGVKEYLLKPIVKEELEKTLCNISQRYKSMLQKKQKARLAEAVYTGKPAKPGEKLQMVYFCAGPLIRDGMEENIAECDFWQGTDIESAAAGLLHEASCVYSFEKNHANEKILLIVPENEADLKDFSKKFLEKMKEKGIQITAAFHEGLIETHEIPMISHQLRRKLQENILFGESSVIENDADSSGNAYTAGDDTFYSLGKEISDTRKEVFLKEAEAFFSVRKIRQKECLQIINRILQSMGEQTGPACISEEDREETIWNLILYSSNVRQLFLNLRRMLDERQLYTKAESSENLMKKVECYILENMAEPITAAVLSSEFGLVAPYLSTLFKEYSGYTLSQYIQKIRLDRAKNLLEMDEEILAKDVAEMVGYPNPLYFSKVFKKKIGVYPSEYRKNKMKKRGERDK